MKCTLVGKYRNTFIDDGGKSVGYGRIYVTSVFDDSQDGEFVGLEASEIKFDYDSVGELPNKLPCSVDIEFDRKGKIRSVQVIGNDGKWCNNFD